MNNLQQPAFPVINQEGDSLEASQIYSEGTTDKQVKYMAESSVLLAKAVIEECNK